MSWNLTGPVDQVAPSLLGATLRHGEVAVRLTEVEAYDGPTDPASHAHRGRTARNAIMFGPPGHLYVYFSYGMHWAANVICGPEGHAAGVLLRAGEVVDGIEVARTRRGRASDRDLARGPGRLCAALRLSSEQKGCYLLGDGPVRLEPPVERLGDGHVGSSGRRLPRGGSAVAVLGRRQSLRVRLQAQPACPSPADLHP